MKRVPLLLALAVLVAGAIAILPAVAAFGPNDVIPRKIIFGNPERNYPIISPDGSRIAFLAPLNGVMNLWVGPTNDLGSAKSVTQEKTRPIREFQWADNGNYLLYLQDEGGNENFHLFAVDLDKGTTKDLTPYKDTRAMIIASSYDRPDEILVGINNRDPRWHDAWLINVVSGEATLVQQNDSYAGFVADRSLNIRLAQKSVKGGGLEIVRLDNGEWKPFAEIPGDDVMTTEPLFFTGDDKTLVMLDSRGRDKAALMTVNMTSGQSSVLAQSEKADVATAIADPVTMKVLAYSADYDRTNWIALDSSVKGDIEFLNKQIAGVWWVISQTKDNNLWTLRVDNINEPVKYGLYDRKAKSLKTLFSTRPSLDGAPLAQMFPRVIKARDGLELVSYLTLPRGADSDGNGLPDQPLPLVLNVHGGPWGRDKFSYNPEHQWLANRGYAVLSANYRGSTGFGKAFINAGDKEWARKMHNDLIDAVNWAVAEGVAQKDKVAIYGGSYGGYAQWATAKEHPPHLSTIVPFASPCIGVDFPMRNNIASPYLMQWLTLVYGRTSQEAIFWGNAQFWRSRFAEFYESGAPFRTLDRALGCPSPIFQRWLSHPRQDEHWDAYNPSPEQYARMRLPVLTITGIYDGDQAGALTHYRRHLAHAPDAIHYLVIGPWDHAGTRMPRQEFCGIKVGAASLIDLRRLHLEWYGWMMRSGPQPSFLKGRVAYYVMVADEWRYAENLIRFAPGTHRGPCRPAPPVRVAWISTPTTLAIGALPHWKARWIPRT